MGTTYIKEKQGCEKFSCCRTTFRKLAENADAVVHLGRAVRYDVEKLEEYVETLKASNKAE